MRRPGSAAAGNGIRGSGAIHGSIDSGIYILETTGDGVSSFEMTIESEIKGARSAGLFTLTLEIEDDDQGEAVRDVTRRRIEGKRGKESAKAAQDAADDDAAFAFVRELATRASGARAPRSATTTSGGSPRSDSWPRWIG